MRDKLDRWELLTLRVWADDTLGRWRLDRAIDHWADIIYPQYAWFPRVSMLGWHQFVNWRWCEAARRVSPFAVPLMTTDRLPLVCGPNPLLDQCVVMANDIPGGVFASGNQDQPSKHDLGDGLLDDFTDSWAAEGVAVEWKAVVAQQDSAS